MASRTISLWSQEGSEEAYWKLSKETNHHHHHHHHHHYLSRSNRPQNHIDFAVGFLRSQTVRGWVGRINLPTKWMDGFPPSVNSGTIKDDHRPSKWMEFTDGGPAQRDLQRY